MTNAANTNRRYRLAMIPGDGIGKEVVPEGIRVLEKVARSHGFELKQDWFDFASADYYVKHGKINATIPKETPQDAVTLEMAMTLLQERAGRKK